MTEMSFWQPQGTVYGTLLNFQREWALWAQRMSQDPYKAPPQAPVLYVKSANTFNPSARLQLQDGVQTLDIGATLGLVMGPEGQVASAVLLNDWAVPHASYYRPPVKFRCRDGYLACGQPVPWRAVDAGCLVLEVQVNGQTVHRVDLATLVRKVPQLLGDVGEFMGLRAGDVLMVGTDCLADGQRPQAVAGDVVHINAPGFAPLVQTVVGEAT